MHDIHTLLLQNVLLFFSDSTSHGGSRGGVEIDMMRSVLSYK